MNSRIKRVNRLRRENERLKQINSSIASTAWRVLAVIILISILILLAAWFNGPDGQTMNLPPTDELIIAWTGEHWYKAYMDKNFEFRNAETGENLGQVIKWKYNDE